MRGKKAKAVRILARETAHLALLKYTDVRPDEPIGSEQVAIAVKRMSRLIKKSLKKSRA